jgi:hypothetical protein
MVAKLQPDIFTPATGLITIYHLNLLENDRGFSKADSKRTTNHSNG